MSKATAEQKPDIMHREKQVLAQYAPVHRTTWWRWVKAGLAPKPVPIGPHAVAWRESELAAWQRGEWKPVGPAGSSPSPA